MRPSISLAALLFPLAACNFSSSPGDNNNNNPPKATFSYEACLLGCGLDSNAIAAGGASTDISFTIASGAAVTSVSTSDPNIATFVLTSGRSSVTATSGKPGTAILTLNGASGILGAANVQVAATSKLVLDGITGPGTILVAAGSMQTLHSTTEAAASNLTLIGTGAVKFTYSGSLTSANDAAICFGDCSSFVGTPGVGQVSIDCIDVHTTLDVQVVAGSAISTIAFDPPALTVPSGGVATVAVNASDNGAPVFGAHCVWSSDPSVQISVNQLSNIQTGPAEKWTISAPKGAWQATCAVAGGGPKQTLTITAN